MMNSTLDGLWVLLHVLEAHEDEDGTWSLKSLNQTLVYLVNSLKEIELILMTSFILLNFRSLPPITPPKINKYLIHISELYHQMNKRNRQLETIMNLCQNIHWTNMQRLWKNNILMLNLFLHFNSLFLLLSLLCSLFLLFLNLLFYHTTNGLSLKTNLSGVFYEFIGHILHFEVT